MGYTLSSCHWVADKIYRSKVCGLNGRNSQGDRSVVDVE